MTHDSCKNCKGAGYLRIPTDFRGPNTSPYCRCVKCTTDDADLQLRLIRDLHRYQKLERALRKVLEDDDYDKGGLSHHGFCNTIHAWGEGPHACDCYVKPVMDALDAIRGNVLDRIVEAIEEDDVND